jgi:hypothetical protein
MVIKPLEPRNPAHIAVSGPNKTLKGHKLLLLAPEAPKPEYLDELRRQFPDLEIVVHLVEWQTTVLPKEFPEDGWKDTTILLASGNIFPARELVPKLQYVQLVSAGANHILKKPLFSDTDIAFCTANGVHG